MSKKKSTSKKPKIRIVETPSGFAPAGTIPSKLVNNMMGRMKARWDELFVLHDNICKEIIAHTESVQATIMTVEQTRNQTGQQVVPDYNEFTVCCNAFWRDMQSYTNEVLTISSLYQGKKGEIDSPDDTALSALVFEKYQQLTVMMHSTVTHMATNMTEYALCAADVIKDFEKACGKDTQQFSIPPATEQELAAGIKIVEEAIDAVEALQASKQNIATIVEPS